MIGIWAMVNSNKYWRAIGKDEFLKWLGVGEKRAKKLTFETMLKLPAVRRHSMRAMGGEQGRFRPAKGVEPNTPGWLKQECIYRWSYWDDLLNKRKTVQGMSNISYDHAALRALWTLFELLFYRIHNGDTGAGRRITELIKAAP